MLPNMCVCIYIVIQFLCVLITRMTYLFSSLIILPDCSKSLNYNANAALKETTRSAIKASTYITLTEKLTWRRWSPVCGCSLPTILCQGVAGDWNNMRLAHIPINHNFWHITPAMMHQFSSPTYFNKTMGKAQVYPKRFQDFYEKTMPRCKWQD